MKRKRRILFNSSGSSPRDCIFCGIASRAEHANVVYEDDKHIAFLDAFPFSQGHTLVCPKEHGETIWDMNEADIAELFRVASRVSKAVVAAVSADGFRFVQNNGEAANQVVAHVHVHIIPVKMEEKGKYFDRKRFPEDQMGSTAELIRKEMDVDGSG